MINDRPTKTTTLAIRAASKKYPEKKKHWNKTIEGRRESNRITWSLRKATELEAPVMFMKVSIAS